MLWKLTLLKLVFDTAKSAARLDVAATNPSTIIVLFTAHTFMAITSLFSSTHMVWILLLEITSQLCSP